MRSSRKLSDLFRLFISSNHLQENSKPHERQNQEINSNIFFAEIGNNDMFFPVPRLNVQLDISSHDQFNTATVREALVCKPRDAPLGASWRSPFVSLSVWMRALLARKGTAASTQKDALSLRGAPSIGSP